MILRLWHKVAPVLSMVVALIVLWYGAAIWLNTHWAEDKAQRAGVTLTITALIADTWSQEKPKLPAPHQVQIREVGAVAERIKRPWRFRVVKR